MGLDSLGRVSSRRSRDRRMLRDRGWLVGDRGMFVGTQSVEEFSDKAVGTGSTGWFP